MKNTVVMINPFEIGLFIVKSINNPRLSINSLRISPYVQDKPFVSSPNIVPHASRSIGDRLIADRIDTWGIGQKMITRLIDDNNEEKAIITQIFQ